MPKIRISAQAEVRKACSNPKNRTIDAEPGEEFHFAGQRKAALASTIG